MCNSGEELAADSKLKIAIRQYVKVESWARLAMILQDEIEVHVVWDLVFCELNAALIAFENNCGR